MMGLLDNFGGNLDDPKTQAMLALGFGLLNSRGNFGQGLGQAGAQAMGVYGDARKAQQQKAMQEQQMQAQALQQQMMQQQLAEAQRAAAEREKLGRLAAGSVISPQQGAMSANGGPTMAAASAVGSTPQGFDWAKYSTGLAAINPMMALEVQSKLKKESPKLSKLEPMKLPTGEMVNIAVFEDGTTKVLPYGVRPDIALQNLGDKVVAVDKNATPSGQSFNIGASPDTRLQVGATIRGQNVAAGTAANRLAFDKEQGGKPQFHDGSWVLPPNAANPQGVSIQVPGFSKPLTEAQGNATAFGMRAKNALENLSKVDTITNGDYYKSRLPWGTGNFLMSANGQAAMNAEKNFIAAMLRKDSGAAISQGEYKEAGDQLFPRPGDTVAQLEQKAKNRDVVLASMDVQAGQSGAKQGAAAMSSLPDRTNRPKPPPPGSTLKFDANGMMVVE